MEDNLWVLWIKVAKFSDGSDEPNITERDIDVNSSVKDGPRQLLDKSTNSNHLPQVPLLKHHKLDIGY